MAKPIVALRIEFRGDEVRVTTLSQSPRGTRYPTGTTARSFERASRDSRKAAIKAAVSAALPVVE